MHTAISRPFFGAPGWSFLALDNPSFAWLISSHNRSWDSKHSNLSSRQNHMYGRFVKPFNPMLAVVEPPDTKELTHHGCRVSLGVRNRTRPRLFEICEPGHIRCQSRELHMDLFVGLRASIKHRPRKMPMQNMMTQPSLSLSAWSWPWAWAAYCSCWLQPCPLWSPPHRHPRCRCRVLCHHQHFF